MNLIGKVEEDRKTSLANRTFFLKDHLDLPSFKPNGLS